MRTFTEAEQRGGCGSAWSAWSVCDWWVDSGATKGNFFNLFLFQQKNHIVWMKVLDFGLDLVLLVLSLQNCYSYNITCTTYIASYWKYLQVYSSQRR